MADHNSIYCPSCHQRTSVETRANYTPPSNHNVRYEVGECNSCSQHFLIQRLLPSGAIVQFYPNVLAKPVDAVVPQPIHDDLEEALVCLAAGAIRASATMARRAVQNICIEKGAPATKEIGADDKKRTVKNDLARQIDWLYNERIITNELKEWAHEIRLVGNAGAHPGDADDKEEITRQDAESVIELAEALCSTLYIKSKIYRDRHTQAA